MPEVRDAGRQADVTQETYARILLRVLPLVSESQVQDDVHGRGSQAIRGAGAIVVVGVAVADGGGAKDADTREAGQGL